MAAPNNAYSFDFLRSEHLDETTKASYVGSNVQVDLSESMDEIPIDAIAVANKPDLEKQFDIIAFLQNHRGSGFLAPSVIYRATGIDLLDSDATVATMLTNNPKVQIENVPDPENPALMMATYAYKAKYSTVRDRATLLAQINRMTSGVGMRDLEDSYAGVQHDIDALITAGDIIAIANTEDKDKKLFPRGEQFIVELDGIISIPKDKNVSDMPPPMPVNGKLTNGVISNSSINGSNGASVPDPAISNQMSNSTSTLPIKPKVVVLETDVDPLNQIRRGEAVQIGGQWFRVSSAVKDGSLSDQPARAQAPLSVTSLVDLSKRNELDGYIRPFNVKNIPTDAPLCESTIEHLQNAKTARERLLKLAHGRSGGVAGQLLGSNAHASNPTTLAASFAGSTTVGHVRKRAKVTANGATATLSSNEPVITKDMLVEAASDPSMALYSHARRHGCTRDVREMYLATRKLVPESDHDMHQALLEHKLIDPGEQLRRPRLAKTGANFDSDGKPKKRRYYERKNQRMTNTHLEGTEIGAILARAAEQQKQGKSVGDGGM